MMSTIKAARLPGIQMNQELLITSRPKINKFEKEKLRLITEIKRSKKNMSIIRATRLNMWTFRKRVQRRHLHKNQG